ncbi:hypothetical protein MRX96_047051 [Rhipicephalus microplus]
MGGPYRRSAPPAIIRSRSAAAFGWRDVAAVASQRTASPVYGEGARARPSRRLELFLHDSLPACVRRQETVVVVPVPNPKGKGRAVAFAATTCRQTRLVASMPALLYARL